MCSTSVGKQLLPSQHWFIVCLNVSLTKSKHARGTKMNAFEHEQDQTMCTCSAYVAFNEPTVGQTDMKHDKAETLWSMSLSIDRVEMLPLPNLA